ncbi:hypothetical protein [Streptomyces sp. NPDC048442]|uniref:hypothetical protein n=1 Tax=Streptomyces sp. NPDC048442 TaxID=3154823 RepID=UPI003432F968
MSAPVAVAPSVGRAPGRRFVPYRHVLHQHRAALLLAVVLAGLAAVLVAGALVWSGPDTADRSWTFTFAEAVRIALPLLCGVLVAGPMVAEELASGTYKLAWTQSVTPARWLAAKLAVAAGVLVALMVPLAVLLWWVRAAGPDPLERAPEPALATVPYAYALLSIALGALAGLLVRHTTWAMTLTAFALVFTLLVLRSQPMETWKDQLTLTVPMLVCAGAGVVVAFLLLRRASQGVAQ